jgi:epoxyqueuosine reductase
VVCPWNKYAQRTSIHDFEPRNGLQAADLLSLWVWSEADFDQRLQGSPIRRIGYERWQRNLAVASGNALRMSNLEVEWARDLRQALEKALVFWTQRNDMVAEHVVWALNQMPEPKAAG